MRRIIETLRASEQPLLIQDISERANVSLSGSSSYAIKVLLAGGFVKVTGKCRIHRNQGRLSKLYALGDTPTQQQEGGLWPFEIEVLQWIANGKTVAEISEITGTKPSPIGKAVEQIFDVLGARNAPGAVAIGFRKGLLK